MNEAVIESKHVIIDGESKEYDPSNLSKSLDEINKRINTHVLGEPLNFNYGKTFHSVRIYEESHGELIFIKDFFGEGKNYVGLNIFTCGNTANPNKISPRMNSYLKELFNLTNYNVPSEENRRKKKIAMFRGLFSNNPINNNVLLEKINESRNGNSHGNHLIVDVHGCRKNLEILTDKKAMEDFLNRLYKSKEPGEPKFMSYGFSPIQGFTHGGVTSFGYKLTENTDFSTSGHTWPEKNNFAAFDFVDYKSNINLENILSYVYLTLDPDNMDWNIYDRFALKKKNGRSSELVQK